MMRGVRITAVSYLNTIPFVYGIKHVENGLRVDLSLCVPSLCADSIKRNLSDIALVPVGALPYLKNIDVISDYCISAEQDVRTVAILCNCDVRDVHRLYVDADSLTSVALARILCEDYWNITPEVIPLKDILDIDTTSLNDAYMLIGDKVFGFERCFANKYDLAVEWMAHTGLPFVFAVWVARKGAVSADQLMLFNEMLAYGVSNLDDAIRELSFDRTFSEAQDYLNHNIKFTLNTEKRKALERFLRRIETFDENASPG